MEEADAVEQALELRPCLAAAVELLVPQQVGLVEAGQVGFDPTRPLHRDLDPRLQQRGGEGGGGVARQPETEIRVRVRTSN